MRNPIVRICSKRVHVLPTARFLLDGLTQLATPFPFPLSSFPFPITSICTSAGAALSVIAFTWLVYYSHGAPPSMWVTGSGMIAGSFFFGANAPIAVELASEIVFPVSEGTSAAYLNLVFMLANLGGMEVANAVSHRASNLGVCAMCSIAVLLLLPMRIPNNRLAIDAAEPVRPASAVDSASLPGLA